MNDEISSRQGIGLSEGEKLNPIQGLDMHKVMLYLASLSKRAENGNGEAAREVFWIAITATAELERIVEKDAAILQGIPLKNVPVVMGENGIKRGKGIAALAKKFGQKLEKKIKVGANLRIRELVDDLAHRLNELRLANTDDPVMAHEVPIPEILSKLGWSPGPHGPFWQGWEHAAQFLPAPASKHKDIWWRVAEAALRDRFPTDAGKWFEHPKAMAIAGRTGKAAAIDTDTARGTISKNIRNRFLEAVQRLPAYTP